MKAISLWQPHASFVANGPKVIETRGWATSHRGLIGIHAAKKRTKAQSGHFGPWGFQGLSGCLWRVADGKAADIQYVPFGAMLATAQLVDVLPIHERFCGCTPKSAYLSRDVGGLGREVLGMYRPGGLAISVCNGTQDEHPWIASQGWDGSESLIEQLPYGDYRHGRFAWLLDDITPLPEPVPCKGGQRIWNWDETA